MIKILMVDDEADIDILATQKFRKEIQENQYHFLFARNGHQALEMLHNDPDIRMVITDINMPQMNGYELLIHVKKNYPHIMAIIVSAYGDNDSIQLARKSGAEGFINKPINFTELKTLIEKLAIK